MRINQFSKYFLLTIIIACLSGCSTRNPSVGIFGETAFQPAKGTVATGNKPLILRLVVNDTYCSATACECIHHLASREYEEVAGVLRAVYHIDLQLTYCIEEYDLGDSVKSGNFDGAICKPWLAFRHVPGSKMKLKRIADILDPFGQGLLGGIFIVKKESLLQKPSDINGKILAMGQEDSYEKYHLALALMRKGGVKPGAKIQKASCTEGINMLLDNQADVAVISDYALFASCAVDIAEEGAFRTIWKTEDIPLCSVILDLTKVNDADAARLQDALLKISGDKVPESFAGKGFVEPVSWIPRPY